MKFLDLSQPLFDACPNCPAHPPISVRTDAHSDGAAASWQMEFFDFASHSGSHVDAPRHKIAGGASLSQLPLETFAGPAMLADLRGIAPSTDISAADLRRAISGEIAGQIVLLCTGWGELRAKTELWLNQSPRLAPDGAQWLVEAGAKGVGIDHFSIGGAHEPNNAHIHEILLGAGVWILEELRFPPEVFDLKWPQPLLALPLNLVDGSGAPCRPVLWLS